PFRLKFSIACLLTILFVILFTPTLLPSSRARVITPKLYPSRSIVRRPYAMGKALPRRPEDDDSQHTLAAPYYRLTEDMNSTLMLRNQGPHSSSVNVTLFSLQGER